MLLKTNWQQDLLNGLFEAGKKVPEDFEILTSNDSPITSYTRPNLSSISQPVYDLGAVSMRMLTKIMNKEELEEKEILLNHGLTIAWYDTSIVSTKLYQMTKSVLRADFFESW
jgi:DNA-binding LacI/PurR family transcriptional regulator